tara:strand:+ start:358 stop:591 length:234 start_codon:yes stop_codon:yes gene_type:complete
MRILKVADSRNDCPCDFAKSGVYMIHKKNIVAQFSFGVDGSFESIRDAFKSMSLYLAKRKDSDNLTVSLLPRGYLDR